MTTFNTCSRRQAMAVLGTALLSGPALAQSDKPIRVIVGVPAGSGTDVVARTVCDTLSKVLGQPVIVDNRPGAGGSLAVGAMLSAPRDGQTWLFAVNGFFSEAPHSIKVKYDPLKDVTPVVEVGGNGLVLVGEPKLPASSMKELVAWVQANKDKVSFASYSTGSLSHVLGLQLNKAEGVNMLHVGYKGSPPALQDLMGGQVQLMFDAPTTSVPLIKSGRLKAFAVSSSQRLAHLPDVPTLEELGYKGMTRTAWLGFWTAPDMPAPLQQRMRAATLQALDIPAVRQRLLDLSIDVNTQTPPTPAQLSARLAADHAAMGAALKAINYQPE